MANINATTAFALITLSVSLLACSETTDDNRSTSQINGKADADTSDQACAELDDVIYECIAEQDSGCVNDNASQIQSCCDAAADNQSYSMCQLNLDEWDSDEHEREEHPSADARCLEADANFGDCVTEGYQPSPEMCITPEARACCENAQADERYNMCAFTPRPQLSCDEIDDKIGDCVYEGFAATADECAELIGYSDDAQACCDEAASSYDMCEQLGAE